MVMSPYAFWSLSDNIHTPSRTFDGDLEVVAGVALDVEEGARLLGGAELEVDVAAVAHLERRQVDGRVRQTERHRVVEDGCRRNTARHQKRNRKEEPDSCLFFKR